MDGFAFGRAFHRRRRFFLFFSRFRLRFGRRKGRLRIGDDVIPCLGEFVGFENGPECVPSGFEVCHDVPLCYGVVEFQ